MADRLITNHPRQSLSERRKIDLPRKPTLYKGRPVTFFAGSGNSHLCNTVAHCVENGVDPIQFIRTAVLTRHLKPNFPRTHVLMGVEHGLYLFDIQSTEMKEEVLDYEGLYVLGSGTPYVTDHLKTSRTEDLPLLFSKALHDCFTGPVADTYDIERKQWAILRFKGARRWTTDL